MTEKSIIMESIETIDRNKWSLSMIRLSLIRQIIGITCVILTAVWCIYFRSGFAWRSDVKLEFNWHPFLAIVSTIFLQGNGIYAFTGILIFKSFGRNSKKKTLKTLHSFIHAISIVLLTISLIAVFDSHNLAKVPKANLYSLHSWIGIATAILYLIQWLVGLITFLYPQLQSAIRIKVMPYHIYLAHTLFILSILSIITGINEKAIFALKSDYHNFVTEGIIMNILGVLTIVYAGLVEYEVFYKNIKRNT